MATNSTINGPTACSENSFGPASCARDFDFTLTFEQSILSILPSALLILVAPLRLFQLSRKRSKTFSNKNCAFKTTAAIINVALQLVLVILWSLSTAIRTQSSVPSAGLSLANAVLILCLSYVEDKKSARPSDLLNIYLVFSMLFDATQVRTLWLIHRTNVAVVQSAGIAIKIAMLCLEAQSKTSYLKQPYKDYPPEAKSSIVNLSFVWWLNELFVTGFRKLITSQDLFNIDPALRSELLGRNLQLQWNKRVVPEGSLALPKAVVYCFRWNLLGTMFPRLCMIGFNFAQPFLITSTIEYIEAPKTDDKNYSYGLIGAAFLIYLGIALSTVHFKQCFARVTTMFRGAMISLLYTHTLRLQDGSSTESAVLTLMSLNINNAWACGVEIAIGIWLLERQLGATCVVPVIVTIVCVVGQGWVAKTIGKDQQRWNEAIQKRVKNTSSMLGSIRPIKISGLSENLASSIQGERARELQISRAFFWGIMWLNGLANVPMIWSPVISFIVFAIQAKLRGDDALTTVQAFTSLSIITLVTRPAAKLLALLPQIAASLGCFERLQGYLVSQPREDTRQGGSSAQSSSKGLDDNEKAEKIELSQIRCKPLRTPNAIAFEKATIIAAPKATVPAVTDLSFLVESGSLVILLGPVGSGKTTVIKAMLGELVCDSGSVLVGSKRISYCSQTSWLLNTTIKESICGPSDSQIDDDWYSTVVHACALDEDIRQWPEGDCSTIGSKGLTLSGGQKQRVALARAVYARQDISLLDDILSALDSKTQEVIGTQLFSKEGLFRRLGTTVVLVTHTARCLHYADKIIVLNSEGRIEMQGTYDDISKKNEFAEYAAIQDRGPSDQISSATPEGESNTKPNSQIPKVEPDKLMDLTRQIGDVAVYSYYVRTIGPPLWIAFVVAHAAAAFTDNFPQVWLNWWTQDEGGHLPLYLSVYAVLALAATILVVFCIWIVFLKIMPQSAIRLHKKLLDTVMNAPQSFFASTDTGVTLNRFSQDMSLVDMALPIALMTAATSTFDCLAKVALISTGSFYMAITIPFTMVAIFILQNVYLKTSRQLRYLDLESKSPLYSHFIETLDGLTTIRAFGWQRTAKDVQKRHLDQSQKPYYMLLCIQRWLNLVLDLMVTALAVIVVALATQLRSTTGAGLVGIALNNILGFNLSLSSLVTSWTSLETSLGAIARVKSFTETTPSEIVPGEDHIPSAEWPESGAITIDHISATYDNTALALDDITLTIAPGQKIGVCGRTGGGKSTLINTLLRLVKISSGTIVIDGVDISTVPREVICQRLAHCNTTRSIYPPWFYPLGVVSDEEIVSALTKIGIWGTLQSRGGLDAILTEQPLSQGQQQLFCLARAMLRKSTVLILDEATSSIDTETDRTMQRVIREEFKNHTIISVAHRLDTILDSEKIAVLDAGKLVDFDKVENLLARNSLFRQMYQS